MELRHLRYFVSVAELGSFTRAAQALFMAQPPLSTQVRQLEEEIGTPLLVRHVRGVSLTPAGATVLGEAKDILARAERLKQNAARAGGGAGRRLNIGFIASASDYLLPRVLPALRECHPGVVVDVREMLSSEQLAALQSGVLDAAICRPPVQAKTLLVAAEFADPFCLVVPAAHPLAKRRGPVRIEQAADADFVSFKRDEARAFFDQTLNFCNAAGFTPTIRCEAGTVFGVLNMVAAGTGVAIVPASCLSAAGPGIVAHRLVAPARHGGLVLVTRKVDRDPAVAQLVTLIKAAFAGLRRLVAARLSS